MPAHASRSPAPAPSAPPSRACSLRHRPANAGTPAKLSASPASRPLKLRSVYSGLRADTPRRDPYLSERDCGRVRGAQSLAVPDDRPKSRHAARYGPPAPPPRGSASTARVEVRSHRGRRTVWTGDLAAHKQGAGGADRRHHWASRRGQFRLSHPVENPDQPDRPVNSPRWWCYQSHPRARRDPQSEFQPVSGSARRVSR